jgi:hypothetical protein
MTSISGAATTDQIRLGLAIGRVSDVGAAGKLDPADPELDWMFLTRFVPTASGAAVDATQHWVFDLKSKRKLGELNQAYILAMSHNAAAARLFNVFARSLVMIP